MFNLSDNTAGPNGKKIKSWSVWFQTPFGLFTNLEEAVIKVQNHEMDPDLAIIPLPVALTEDSYECWKN